MSVLELRSMHAYIVTDKKQFQYYDELAKEYEKQLRDYLVVKRNYDKISHIHITERNRKVFEKEGRKAIVELEALDFHRGMHWFKFLYLDVCMFFIQLPR